MQIKLLAEAFHKQALTPEFVKSQGLSERCLRRFWNKVEKGPGCWSWIGALTDKGYGIVRKPNKKQCLVHRLSWIMHYGPIEKGMNVLHRCDNPRCVNPTHLWLGSQADNVMDMILKRRFPNGANGGRPHKLTIEQVYEIREKKKSGAFRTLSYVKIANLYGIHPSGIWRILAGKNWKHLISPQEQSL